MGGWATATVTVHVREREGWIAQVKGEGAGEGGAREGGNREEIRNGRIESAVLQGLHALGLARHWPS